MTDQQLLDLFETAIGLHPVSRAALLTAAFCPGLQHEHAAAMPVGARNRLLWDTATRWIGNPFVAVDECPSCGSRQDFELPGRHPFSGRATADAITVDADGIVIRARPPDSNDLLVAAEAPTAQGARRVLLDRCVEVVTPDDRTPADLDDAVVARVERALEEADPGAAMQMDLGCAACGERWVSGLDIADFLWVIVRARAERLMDDIAALAAAYGWPESDVLAMTSWRRQAYLERAAR
jgi:hypothetical protein